MNLLQKVAAAVVISGCVCGIAQRTPDQLKQIASQQPQAAPKEDPGFQPIFNGKSLEGWEGDSKYWRVENGSLVGQSTAENPLKQNTFVIWKGASPGDFELKLEYKLSAQGNSGVQYRSQIIADRQFGLRGYQADIDADNRYTGQIYEEGGRQFLALRGQFNRIQGEGNPAKLITGSVGDGAQLAGLIKKQDWNELHIVARGNTLVQFMNGQLMSGLIDDDAVGRKPDGLIGLQLHTGPAMRIEYRNVRLKRY